MNVLLDECIPRKLKHELKGHFVAVVLLLAKDNDLDTLKPLLPKVRQILESLEMGRVFRVGPS